MVIIFTLPFLPKILFSVWSLTCARACVLPALISLCPEAWDETWSLPDNTICETHRRQSLHCARCALLAHVPWVCLGELDKMESTLLEEGESGTGSRPLPNPQPPKISGGNGHGQARKSGCGSRWSSHQARPPPARPQGVKGLQGLGPGAGTHTHLSLEQPRQWLPAVYALTWSVTRTSSWVSQFYVRP